MNGAVLDSLEPRRLFSTVTFNPIDPTAYRTEPVAFLLDGTLTVVGTPDADRFTLKASNGRLIVVGGDGQTPIPFNGTWPLAREVGAIKVQLGHGDDVADFSLANLRVEAFGSWGNDTLLGGKDSDLLNGGGGEDDLSDGGGEYDWLGGDGGRDTLRSEDGHDILLGGGSNDRLVADGPAVLNGGTGVDTISLTQPPDAMQNVERVSLDSQVSLAITPVVKKSSARFYLVDGRPRLDVAVTVAGGPCVAAWDTPIGPDGRVNVHLRLYGKGPLAPTTATVYTRYTYYRTIDLDTGVAPRFGNKRLTLRVAGAPALRAAVAIDGAFKGQAFTSTRLLPTDESFRI